MAEEEALRGVMRVAVSVGELKSNEGSRLTLKF